VTNTQRHSCLRADQAAHRPAIKLNVTCGHDTWAGTRRRCCAQSGHGQLCLGVRGRIADTGVDPLPLMAEAVAILRKIRARSFIWASPRELLNIFRPTRSDVR